VYDDIATDCLAFVASVSKPAVGQMAADASASRSLFAYFTAAGGRNTPLQAVPQQHSNAQHVALSFSKTGDVFRKGDLEISSCGVQKEGEERKFTVRALQCSTNSSI
jgi:hypothetical protein